MLYIFASAPPPGNPPPRLNAGGLQYAIERVEEIALLHHGTAVQYTKDSPDYHLSDLCLASGITWMWFRSGWEFGNGVTVHKTQASYETKVVVHGTEQSLEEFLGTGQSVKLADLQLTKIHNRTEGWAEYEARWEPGTCPQENHLVHLTWLITREPLPTAAYERIREMIEDHADFDRSQFEEKHFSVVRPWHPDGQRERALMV